MAEEEAVISIEDLELALEVYEIESQQKLEQLKKLFEQKGSLDLTKMFYEQRSSIQIKFQNIIGDLIEFLVKQEVGTTEKLRKTFYRILQNPLLLLFKVSRFQIFDLRFNGFDIELEPIEAVAEVGKSLQKSIDEYLAITAQQFEPYDGKQYKSWNAFLQQATINQIQQRIFVLYSYLRKGSALFKKKFQHKVKIIEIFNNAEAKLLSSILQRQDTKTMKQLSILNYQIYELEPSFDVLYFYLHIPLLEKYKQCFQELEVLGAKSRQSSNYNSFILLYIKHEKLIREKLASQKVDAYFKGYIENALKSILEMWGCRICYYKEFCQLFKLLFKLIPAEVEALELCLKHTPDLKKDDVVLLRTNFKLEIGNKNNELLSLLKPMSLDEINEFLNSFYHKTLYNTDLKKLQREVIINLLTLMNGNSSLFQFFAISERAFKEWNHTIDFNHPHKFIETQFAYPNIQQEKVKESLILLTNLFVMQQKGFNKQYETLIKTSSIGKTLLQLIKFVQRQQKCQYILKWPQTHRFLVECFRFLGKALNPATQTESLALTFSTLLDRITTEDRRLQLESELIEAIQGNVQSFHIQSCLNCFKLYRAQNFARILSIFMAGVLENNQMVKKFAYLQQSAQKLAKMSVPKDHADFIREKCRISNGLLSVNDPAVFNLSDLEVMTIPTQIDKVIDNYYFTLDSNAKKLVQYLVQTWNKKRLEQSPEIGFFSQLVQSLIVYYPICVPLIASVRVEDAGTSRRFIELLSSLIEDTNTVSELVLGIARCRGIRYKNGKDYIQQQVIPMALKEIIKMVNSKNEKQTYSQKFLVLSELLERSNLSEIKLDTIQKSIEKLRYLLSNSTSAAEAQTYSKAFHTLMRNFFRKKELEMRKKGLLETYDKLAWNQVRNYVANNTENKADLKDESIIEYIVITPFTIAQEFNINEYRIKKVSSGKNSWQGETAQVSLGDILKTIPSSNQKEFTGSLSKNLIQQNKKKLFLTNLKYDLAIYIGAQNINQIAQKQNAELFYSQSQKGPSSEPSKPEDLSSFIQYYVKSLALPSISHKIILESSINLIEADDSSISYLWTNPKNLQNYFINLISIFQYAAVPQDKRPQAKDPEVQRIVQLISKDSLSVMKKVLKIFADLGYSNIWGESLDIFWSNFPVRNFLGFPKSEESFFSLLLRNTLENPHLVEGLTNFLGCLFSTRKDQNALMYKVTMDRNLMNIIMKSLSIPHLERVSLMFHSNFNNLRLYTDQLHEGLKALNIASKNRAYNQFIKISKSIEDEEFSGPLKLFKQNFSFFIRIEKEGYIFKKNEEKNLVLGRLSNIFRSAADRENISGKINDVISQYIKQVTELQIAIANRVKSFYLVTKLRDLSYQNALMIPIIYEVMQNTGKSEAQILEEINKLQIFSLVSTLYNDLVRYEDDWRDIQKYSNLTKIDGYVMEGQLTLCTTRRFSHSMSKIYQSCDLEFDEIMQRCIDALKSFFGTSLGNKWLQSVPVYPAFLIKSFIDRTKATALSREITSKLNENPTTYQIQANEGSLVQTLLKGFRGAPRSAYVNKGITVVMGNQKRTPLDMLKPLHQRLVANETFITLKPTGNIIFNKYKSSEATLEQIQVLGYIISYAILNKLPLQMSLHPSIVSALSFNIAQLDYLLDIDFKVWEELKNVLSVEDSAPMSLNFSYVFESLDNLKPIRIELIDKGSSKKVNNLNREQYCDLVCCYILYEYCRPQINRLLTTILSIVPKQLISCTSTKQILDLFYDKTKSQKIGDEYMRKIGIVLPETLIDEKGKRVENLKDFQNVQWLQEIILETPQLRSKYWPDETNLFVVTTIGGQGSVRLVNGRFLVEHFNSKQQMRAALAKL